MEKRKIDRKKVSNNIYKLRTQNNLSRIEMANKLQVKPDIYNKWERGVNLPGIISILKICNSFDITIDELLGL